jgi:hypothetical protein
MGRLLRMNSVKNTNTNTNLPAADILDSDEGMIMNQYSHYIKYLRKMKNAIFQSGEIVLNAGNRLSNQMNG